MPPEQEGVIKYQLIFTACPLTIEQESLADLNRYRDKMIAQGLLGQDSTRYEGFGFGNISLRCSQHVFVSASQNASRRVTQRKSIETESTSSPKMNSPQFWISGSQTGHLRRLEPAAISLVTDLKPTENTLWAQGETEPSSESMTHGVLFQLDPKVQAVIHVHSPEIWSKRILLGLPSTHESIPYGTPAMANAVQELGTKLLRSSSSILFCMDGHEDGVVVAGSSLKECTTLILETLSKAQQAP